MDRPQRRRVVTDLWRMEVFFDGECPLCRREIAMLRGLDRHGRIRFTDIASEPIDAVALGRTFEELMARIHARTRDGEWITGVEVLRQLYEAVGLGWLASWTR